MEQAQCPKCHDHFFVITDEYVKCINCMTKFEFDFLDSTKTICETKAEDIVMLVNEGK